MHPRKEVHEKSRGLALDLLGEFPGKVLVEEYPGRKLKQKEMSSYSLGVWRRDAHNILVSGRQWALGKRMSRIWGMVRN